MVNAILLKSEFKRCKTALFAQHYLINMTDKSHFFTSFFSCLTKVQQLSVFKCILLLTVFLFLSGCVTSLFFSQGLNECVLMSLLWFCHAAGKLWQLLDLFHNGLFGVCDSYQHREACPPGDGFSLKTKQNKTSTC